LRFFARTISGNGTGEFTAENMTRAIYPLKTSEAISYDLEWDAGHMGCGELLLKLRRKLHANPGRVIKLTALDRGALEDIPSYCRITRHRLLMADMEQGIFLILARS
jgi:tRNA 2-thiouridine synthesizing protein A